MISTLLVVALAPETFIFRGGNDADFVNALAAHTKRPAVALADPDRVWPPMHFSYRDPNDLYRGIMAVAQESVVVTGENVVFGWAYPEGFFRRETASAYRGRFESRPGGLTKQRNGALHVNMRWPRTLSLADLATVAPDLVKECHWFYHDARFVASNGAWHPTALRTSMVRAVGADLNEASGVIGFWPAEFRKRVAPLRDAPRPPGEMTEEELKSAFEIEAFVLASDAQLLRLYAARSSSKRLELAFDDTTSLDSLASQLLARMFSSERVRQSPKRLDALFKLAGEVDPTVLPEAHLSSTGKASLVLRGRSGQVVFAH